MAKRKRVKLDDHDNAIVQRNRQNAQLSTGPKTDNGKAVVRRNAIRTGLYVNAAEVVIPEVGETDEMWHDHLAAYVDAWRPGTQYAVDLVQELALATWKLKRIRRAERQFTDLKQRRADDEWIDSVTGRHDSVLTVEDVRRMAQLGPEKTQKLRTTTLKQITTITAELRRVADDSYSRLSYFLVGLTMGLGDHDDGHANGGMDGTNPTTQRALPPAQDDPLADLHHAREPVNVDAFL